MRLFLALRLEETALRALTGLQGTLTGDPVPRENLHLTLAFLGETAPDRVPPLRSLVRNMTGIPEVLTAQGWFRRRQKRGDLLAVAIRRDPALMDLQRRLTEDLTRLGCPLEDRDYLPHITLLRRARLPEELPIPELPDLQVRSATLMLSHRPEGVLTYSTLAERNVGN